jgi:hypothetical protein
MTMTDDTGVRSGVTSATLFATFGPVKPASEGAPFQFRASSRWVSGTPVEVTAG